MQSSFAGVFINIKSLPEVAGDLRLFVTFIMVKISPLRYDMTSMGYV